MSVTSLIEFDDAAEHDFDTANMELASDRGRLRSQVLSSEILFANYDEDTTIPDIKTSKRGGKTLAFGGLNNTGEVSGGKLTFPNEDRSIATYANITDIVDDFALRCRVEANIVTTGQPRNVVRLQSNVDSSLIEFQLANQGSGITRMYRRIVDSAGSTVQDLVLGTKDMSVDPNWNVAISNDDDGNILTYLDGVLVSTIASPTLNFTDCDLILSDDTSASSDASSNYDNLQLWNANVLTAAFGFPFPEDTTYVLPEELMDTKIPLLVDEVLELTLVEQIPAGTQLKHFFWLDGDAWKVDPNTGIWALIDLTQDLLPQANTAAELNSNLSTLPVVKGIGKLMEIGHVFKSDSGYDTPEIESLTLKYSYTFKSGDVTLCTVFGTVKDNCGKPVAGAKVWVMSDDRFKNNTLIAPSIFALSNAQGKFSITVPETETENVPVTFVFEYLESEPNGETPITEYVTHEVPNKIVSNLPTCPFDQLPDAS